MSWIRNTAFVCHFCPPGSGSNIRIRIRNSAPEGRWRCSACSRRRWRRRVARVPAARTTRQTKSRARCAAAPPPPPPGCARTPAGCRATAAGTPSRPGPVYTAPSHLAEFFEHEIYTQWVDISVLRIRGCLSRIRIFPSRIHGQKRHRIPDPDHQQRI
jgi:hypothetical protein